MRIRQRILCFINQKIFRHELGVMPNKFTNFVYFLLMPIKYIVQHNTSLRYDFVRDVYIINKMEFSRDFLCMTHDRNRHELDALRYIQPRPYGKQYSAFLRCVTQIEAGCNTVFLGLKWMMISTDHYKTLTDKSKDAFPYIKPKWNLKPTYKPKHLDELKTVWLEGKWDTSQNFFKKQKKEETMKSNIGIARVCHEANRQYCIDNKLPTQALWDELPVTQQNIIIHGVEQVIANPKITATKMHEIWLEYKASEGWKYAEVLDVKNKTHPNMLSFNKLPKDERGKDMLFIKTVKAELKKL